MAVTLADCQHSGNDPQQISPQKIILSLGAIISATVFRNGWNTPKGSTPPYPSRSRSRYRRTGVRKAKELHLDWGKQDKGVINCSRHCLLSTESPGVMPSQQEPPQTISEPPVSRNRQLDTKYRAFRCLPPLMWTSGLFQTIPGAFIMWLSCSTIDPLSLSTSKHKSTPMICAACSPPSTISSLPGSWHQSIACL